MENPFEVILQKLEVIEEKIDSLNKTESNNELMDVQEVADYLHFSKATIYGKIQKRELPHIKRGKKLYFRKNDIDDWLGQGKAPSKEEIKRMADEYILKNSKFY